MAAVEKRHIVAYAIFFASCILMVAIAVVSVGVSKNYPEIMGITGSLPDDLSSSWVSADTGEAVDMRNLVLEPGHTVVLQRTISDEGDDAHLVLALKSRRLDASLSSDGQSVGQVGPSSASLVSASGSVAWSVTSFESGTDGKTLQLTLRNDSSAPAGGVAVVAGEEHEVARYILYTDTWPDLAVALLLLVMTIFGFVQYANTKDAGLDADFASLKFLPLLMVCFFLWTITADCPLEPVLGAGALQSTLCLFSSLLMPVALLAYYHSMVSEWRLAYRIMYFFVLIALLACMCLLSFGLIDITMGQCAAYVLLVIVSGFLVVQLAYEVLAKGHSNLKGPFAALIVLVLASCAYLFSAGPGFAHDRAEVMGLGYAAFGCIVFFTEGVRLRRKYRKQAFWKRYQQMAFTDDVTGGNTLHKLEDVAAGLGTCKGHSLLSITPEQFRLVNESRGVDYGNGLLRDIYWAIDSCIGPEEVMCRRMASFLIYIEASDESQIIERYRQIYKRLEAFERGNLPGSRMGFKGVGYVCMYANLDTHLALSRIAMAKSSPLADSVPDLNLRIYNEACRRQAMREEAMASMLDSALENHEFQVYLQPKVHPVTGRVLGAEALARWVSPSLGSVPPNEFIPLFERKGRIHEIDYYMYCEVCKILGRWRKEGIDLIPISVNLSNSESDYPSYLCQYRKAAAAFDVPAGCLDIEITESVAYEENEELQAFLRGLKDAGMRCSMDDFGSGYSNLRALDSLGFDTVKMDKSLFDGGFPEDENKDTLAEGIMGVLKKMNVTVVAEGVENKAQALRLAELGCDMVQGFYFSKPLPYDEFMSYYRAHS